MGWRLRKSMGIGKLLRVNLSRSGVGFSLGIPGFRVSLGADKKVRRTVGLPGTGVFNTEVIGDLPQDKPAKSRRKSPPRLCVNCGKAVDKQANFCPHCGEKM